MFVLHVIYGAMYRSDIYTNSFYQLVVGIIFRRVLSCVVLVGVLMDGLRYRQSVRAPAMVELSLTVTDLQSVSHTKVSISHSFCCLLIIQLCHG